MRGTFSEVYKFNKLEDKFLEDKGKEIIEETKVNRRHYRYDNNHHSEAERLLACRPSNMLEFCSSLSEIIYEPAHYFKKHPLGRLLILLY